MKKTLMVLCFIASLLGSTPRAEGSDINTAVVVGTAVGTGVFSLAMTSWLGVTNLKDGMHHKGDVTMALGGIGVGALSLVIGGVLLASNSSTVSDYHLKPAVAGPLLALGTFTAATGVYALFRQEPVVVGVVPMVITQNGVSPGLSMSIPLP